MEVRRPQKKLSISLMKPLNAILVRVSHATAQFSTAGFGAKEINYRIDIQRVIPSL